MSEFRLVPTQPTNPMCAKSGLSSTYPGGRASFIAKSLVVAKLNLERFLKFDVLPALSSKLDNAVRIASRIFFLKNAFKSVI